MEIISEPHGGKTTEKNELLVKGRVTSNDPDVLVVNDCGNLTTTGFPFPYTTASSHSQDPQTPCRFPTSPQKYGHTSSPSPAWTTEASVVLSNASPSISESYPDSKYSRLTSICLYRSTDILRFEAAITPLPPNERRVRYLHITSPHLFLDISEDELENDADYEFSGSESSFDNDDTFATAENPGDDAGMGNVEMDVDESDSDDDEYRPLSPAEESEVHDDVAYFNSSATSSESIASHLFEGKDPMGEYMAEMDEANSIILSSVNQIVSTLSSTLYALSIHWTVTKEVNSGYLSIPDFIPCSASLLCLTEFYLCVNLRAYTWESTRPTTYPESIFYMEDFFLERFNGLAFPALRGLRFAGLAWSALERTYDTVKRLAPNLTHVRTKTDMG